MKKKSGASTWIISRALLAGAGVMLTACANMGYNSAMDAVPMATPTVDYVETLDVYSAPHRDSFLNQLAMNYRSYAVYNARTSGYSEMGEMFAQKAVAAFSGEVPFPESLDNWPVEDDDEAYELHTAYNDLMDQLKNDASENHPQLSAEAQAKFDCWLSAAASGQRATANQCRDRFMRALETLKNCDAGQVVDNTTGTPVPATPTTTASIISDPVVTGGNERVVTFQQTHTVTNASNVPTGYYPDTRNMAAMNGAARTREGVIIVNNVNVPENLVQPVSVPDQKPLIFNQNIYGGDKSISNSNNTGIIAKCNGNPECVAAAQQTGTVGDEFVTREEFINMMMAMRAELAAINARLDDLQAASGEKTFIKVQQIPLEPQQHVMEEVFEVRFDFDKSTIKPEYEALIKKLVNATQDNKNIKVTVIGHTDTMGSQSYNYALGGRRAEAVQKMLIKYGIPASQIVAVSAGEEDLAVKTGDNVANAANRRVQVIKEIHQTEPSAGAVTVVEEYTETQECGMYGCE